jgi:hypothetical protein
MGRSCSGFVGRVTGGLVIPHGNGAEMPGGGTGSPLRFGGSPLSTTPWPATLEVRVPSRGGQVKR